MAARPPNLRTTLRPRWQSGRRSSQTPRFRRSISAHIAVMRIIDIREAVVPVNSTLANSSIDFSEMTTSVVAVITDVTRGGRPVCGFAFNSTGRYACGAQMRARFIPRILKAQPDSLLDDDGDLAPEKILAVMLHNEKSGGHSERSIGIGTIEVAVWDALAKILENPLHRLLAERFNGGKIADKVFCYLGGGPSLTRGGLRRSPCSGWRSRAIRSTSRCSPRSRQLTGRRCRPARICFQPRTWKTWCASA